MPTPVPMPYGPFQPLGTITVATAGTPVALNVNLGQYYTQTGKSEYAMSWSQLWIRAASTNTGALYLVTPGQTATNTDSIIWYLLPGEYIFIGSDALSRNTYSFNDLMIDAATNGNSCIVTGVVGA
jgi:hypothetical protein